MPRRTNTNKRAYLIVHQFISSCGTKNAIGNTYITCEDKGLSKNEILNNLLPLIKDTYKEQYPSAMDIFDKGSIQITGIYRLELDED